MHTTTRTSRKYEPSVVARLRELTPRRPLSFSEGVRIAQLQATKLLELTGCHEGPVPASVITGLPRIEVQRSEKLIGSGMTMWSGGQWRIRIKASDPITRQRFTLAHELKHVVDAAHEEIVYRHLPPGQVRRTHVEAICDAFAAALLMPKPWVKQQWYAGNQDVPALAWSFGVSLQAMHIRLQTLGLIEHPRHSRYAFYLGHTAVRGSRHRYYRLRAPLIRRHAYHRPLHRLVPTDSTPRFESLIPSGAT
jgi:Zn-dependent peptidase ImmA (M78 family)